jgi:hypothetical protein
MVLHAKVDRLGFGDYGVGVGLERKGASYGDPNNLLGVHDDA